MTKKACKAFGVLILATVASGANAASVTLVPTSPVFAVVAGDLVSFDIFADFSDIVTNDGSQDITGTGGGGFDILFDPATLAFVDATRSGLGESFFSRLPNDTGTGILDDWTEARFGSPIVSGMVGSVAFEVLAGLGNATTAVTLANATLQGANPSLAGFWQAFGDDSEILPTYNSVNITGIPVPAAVWLLASGLGAFLGLRKKI